MSRSILECALCQALYEELSPILAKHLRAAGHLGDDGTVAINSTCDVLTRLLAECAASFHTPRENLLANVGCAFDRAAAAHLATCSHAKEPNASC